MSIIISFQEKSHLNDRFPLNECFKFSRKTLLSPPPDLQGQQLFQHLLLRRDIAQGQPLDNLAVSSKSYLMLLASLIVFPHCTATLLCNGHLFRQTDLLVILANHRALRPTLGGIVWIFPCNISIKIRWQTTVLAMLYTVPFETKEILLYDQRMVGILFRGFPKSLLNSKTCWTKREL